SRAATSAPRGSPAFTTASPVHSSPTAAATIEPVTSIGAGTLLIDPKYYFAQPFAEGLALVQQHGHPFQFIDRSGSVVIEIDATTALSFSGGLAAVRVRDASGEPLWSYLHRTGAAGLSGLRYRFCGVFKEGRAGCRTSRAAAGGSSTARDAW